MVSKFKSKGASGEKQMLRLIVETAAVKKDGSRRYAGRVVFVVGGKYGKNTLQAAARCVVEGKGDQLAVFVNLRNIRVRRIPNIVKRGRGDKLLERGVFLVARFFRFGRGRGSAAGGQRQKEDNRY